MENYGTGKQDTDKNVIRSTRFTCCITKAIDTRSKYVIVFAFYGGNGYANSPQCYISYFVIFGSIGTISAMI